MTERSPAFQFYPKDFLSDPDVAVMSYAEKGIYITLLCYIWLNDGIPDDDEYIGKLLGKPKGWLKMLEKVKRKFVLKSGRVHHKRLLKERKKQEDYRRSLREAGKKGAEIRWGSHSQAIKRPMAKNSSPSPSPSPYVTNGEGRINSSVNKDTPPFPPSELEKIQEDNPRVDIDKSLKRFIQHRRDRGLPVELSAFRIWVEKDSENGWSRKEPSSVIELFCPKEHGSITVPVKETYRGVFCKTCNTQLLEKWELPYFSRREENAT